YSGVQSMLKGDKWNSFQTLLGQKFSEKIIFKELVNKYLVQEGVTYQFEDNTKGWDQDLYHRKNNHVSFVEYKNVKLALKDTFTEIKADVDNKMVQVNKDGKTKKKAVYQLIDQIKSFHDNINKYENIEDAGYTRERLFIYPVIMFTEYNWRLPGINDYLNRIFKSEISKLNFKFFSVSELVMMHTDFFYFHEDIFLKDKANLHQVIYNGMQVKETFRIAGSKYKIPPAQAIMNSYSDFDFCANIAYIDKVNQSNKMSFFYEVLAKLDAPK
ncbi:MAG TPA: hypothetical protein VNY36_03145, partial [Bacteroidia bacterium]|nr:hypothetical protein [Bacteroidia bacterium]